MSLNLKLTHLAEWEKCDGNIYQIVVLRGSRDYKDTPISVELSAHIMSLEFFERVYGLRPDHHAASVRFGLRQFDPTYDSQRILTSLDMENWTPRLIEMFSNCFAPILRDITSTEKCIEYSNKREFRAKSERLNTWEIRVYNGEDAGPRPVPLPAAWRRTDR